MKNHFTAKEKNKRTTDNPEKRAGITSKIKPLLAALFALYAIAPASHAMHVMEGYLPLGWCIAWYALSIPFVVLGFIGIRKIVENDRKTITLLAITGAFIFVISSLKIPSVTGSCSHMTGTGLGAILFGPCITSILGLIVLVFQAILLAHGGLTTLGANCFSMAIAGPIVSWAIYKVLKSAGVNKKVTIFIAAFLGDLFTYCVTSVELAMAYHTGGFGAALVKFLANFAATQIPLAIIEGILTVVIMIGLEAYANDELKALKYA
ncbi:MAG: energy-coupling factor ABC transporter permease [Eubacterium sp.]|nr:energy-coupling factor ABC transporter permease [Eubacterium sp.]